MREQEGEVKLDFADVGPDTFAIRINRYGLEGRRSDIVEPDPSLTLWETTYSLRAIVLYQGSSVHRGHYIMFLRSSTGWEKRDDGCCIPCGSDDVPPCNPSDVYLLVYKKHEALSALEALAAEQSRADAIRRGVEAERQRQEEEQEAERQRREDEANAVREAEVAAAAAKRARVEMEREELEAAERRKQKQMEEEAANAKKNEKLARKPRPFQRIGNQCWINATLQALFAPQRVKDILADIYQLKQNECDVRSRLLPTALKDRGYNHPGEENILDEDLLAVTYHVAMTAPDHLPMIPNLLWSKYYRGLQEDASELLMQLLDADTGSPSMARIFEGIDRPELACSNPECSFRRRAQQEAFNTIVIQIRNEDGQVLRDVQTAVAAYMQAETLGAPFEWLCASCGSTEAPRKEHHIVQTPEVLLVQLCRWYAADAAGAILDAVHVNEYINFQENNYRLSSSIMHQGRNPRSGHYLSCARHGSAGNEWWLYNDTLRRLTRSGERESTAENKSYIMFYERVSDQQRSAEERQRREDEAKAIKEAEAATAAAVAHRARVEVEREEFAAALRRKQEQEDEGTANAKKNEGLESAAATSAHGARADMEREGLEDEECWERQNNEEIAKREAEEQAERKAAREHAEWRSRVAAWKDQEEAVKKESENKETEDGKDEDAHRQEQEHERKSNNMESLFQLAVEPVRVRKYSFERMHDAAQHIAANYFRKLVTLPSELEHEDVQSGCRLPLVSCAFKGCDWCLHGSETQKRTSDSEHSSVIQLRQHVWEAHNDDICDALREHVAELDPAAIYWDVYKEALATCERQGFPAVGLSVDRRAFEYATQVYQDDRIRSLICFACARICLDTGGVRSQIEYKLGGWVFSIPGSSLLNKFSFAEYTRRYRKPGTPLAPAGSGARNDIRQPDFNDWQLRLDADNVESYVKSKGSHKGLQPLAAIVKDTLSVQPR